MEERYVGCDHPWVADRVLLDPDLEPALRAAGLADADGLFRLGGESIPGSVVRTVDLDLEGTVGRFHLKRYHYAGWRKSRGLVGRGTLWGEAPELREFGALAWLRARGFPAVRPVLAASRTRGGRLVTHALLTEHVPHALDLQARLDDDRDPLCRDGRARGRVLARLADLLREVHAAGFVHRDARPRNVLVPLGEDGADGVPGDGAGPLWLLDCRRGGKARWRSGSVLDLATMDRDLAMRLTRTERWRMLRRYAGDHGPAIRVLAMRVLRLEKRERRAPRPAASVVARFTNRPR